MVHMQGRRSTIELWAQNKKGVKIENKKEVIQPQVPLRLPCDDLTHLTEFRFVLPKKADLT
jgi:hypothetical protein